MVFCFVQRFFFSDNTRVRIIIFFCRAKREIFFQTLTLDYDKNSESDYLFFSSTIIRIFFSATLGIRIFFLEINNNPPPPPLFQVKWPFPNLHVHTTLF